MSTDYRVLLSVGEIARQIGEPVWRIEYQIRSRNIQPTGRAGNARVFDEADVSYITNEICHIDRERRGVS